MKCQLIVWVCALFIMSCSSDDDGGSKAPSIVGTWELSKANSEFPLDLNNDDTFSTDLLSSELPCFKTTIVVNADASYTQTTTEVTVKFETTVNEIVVTATCAGTSITESGTWSLDGSQLTFDSANDDPETVGIGLTETTLSFSDTIEGFDQKLSLEFTRQ